MSVQGDPVPNPPQHDPAIEERESGKGRFARSWMQWFLLLRDKINVINALLVQLSQLTGQGFLALFDGNFYTRSLQGPMSVQILNGDGSTGDPDFRLKGDELSPPNLAVYGVDHLGTQHFFRPPLFESTGVLLGGGLSIAGLTSFNVAQVDVGMTDYTTPLIPVRTTKSLGPFLNVPVTNIALPATWVGIDVTAATPALSVVQQSSPFSPMQQRTIAQLGAVISNGVQLIAINNLTSVLRAGINQTHDFMDAIGPINKSGNKISPNGATMQINKSAGVEFKQGGNFVTNPNDPHNITLAALTPASFNYRLSNGTTITPAVNIIDAANYENPLGTVTAVPGANRFTIQRIYVFTSNLIRIQYGQFFYNTMAQAEAALTTENFVTEANIAENGLLLCFLIVADTATDLSNPAQAKFVPATKFGGPLGSGGTTITNTDSLPEGVVNLYFTNARALAAIPAGTTGQFFRGDKTMTNELFSDYISTLDGSGSGFIGTKYSADNIGVQFRGLKSRGSLAVPAGVLANDTILGFQGRTQFTTAGVPSGFTGNIGDMQLSCLEPHTNVARGTGWSFSVTQIGSLLRGDRFRIQYAFVDGGVDNVTNLGQSTVRWAQSHVVNTNRYGSLFDTGIVSMASLAADVNDWVITNMANVHIVRCGATGANRTITGIAGFTAGQKIRLVNITTLDLILPHENVGSAAANRFANPGAATVTVNGGDSIELWYDSTTSRIRPLGL